MTSEISGVLAKSGGALVGLTSLADGADQLFARAVLERGGHLHVVIPCERYATAFADAASLATYRELLAAASEVETLPFPEPSQQAFLEAGQRVVDSADLLIAVWDGAPARGPGGTADIVQYARDRNRAVAVVWPAGASRA